MWDGLDSDNTFLTQLKDAFLDYLKNFWNILDLIRLTLQIIFVIQSMTLWDEEKQEYSSEINMTS